MRVLRLLHPPCQIWGCFHTLQCSKTLLAYVFVNVSIHRYVLTGCKRIFYIIIDTIKKSWYQCKDKNWPNCASMTVMCKHISTRSSSRIHTEHTSTMPPSSQTNSRISLVAWIQYVWSFKDKGWRNMGQRVTKKLIMCKVHRTWRERRIPHPHTHTTHLNHVSSQRKSTISLVAWR